MVVITCSTSTIAVTRRTRFDRCRWWKRLPTGSSGHRGERQGSLRYPREGCALRLGAQRVGRPRALPGPVGLRESGGRGGRQQHETDSRGQGGAILCLEKRQGRYVAHACGSGCAHSVTQAHSPCSLFPLLTVCNILVCPAARDLLPLLHCFFGRIARWTSLDVGFNAVSTALFWRRRWWMLLIRWQGVQAQAAFRSVALA